MKANRLLGTALLVVAGGVIVAHASDPTGCYARVDKVVLAPTSESPDTIQVAGVFSVARANGGDEYLPPARGYLYFKLGRNPGAARREWNDLKQLAGSRQIVAIGSRYEARPRVRPPDDPPQDPDPYVVVMGLTRLRGNTEYAPIRALLDFRP
jgi:hypothetical protein